MTEGALIRRILLAISQTGCRLFRNNVGVAYYPRTNAARAVMRAMVRRGEASRVTYGLETGSSDLIGWQTVEIRPDDVGRRVAVFAAVEVKTERVCATHAQRRFIHAVLQAGGLAGVARSEDEALAVARWEDREPIQETL